ncbi:MAG: hypothetical protein ACLUNZ_13875 [Evtepia sp.]
MPKTWAQIWTEMQNKALSVFSPILTKLSEIGNSDRFSAATDGPYGGAFWQLLASCCCYDLRWPGDRCGLGRRQLGDLVPAASWALRQPCGATTASVAATGRGHLQGLHVAQAAAKMLQLAVTGKLTAVTAAETAAQYGLNAAMYACPIVWIIMLILALVALFYAAVAAVNHFAGTSVSATGIICGAFLVVLAVVGNVFVSLYNLVSGGICPGSTTWSQQWRTSSGTCFRTRWEPVARLCLTWWTWCSGPAEDPGLSHRQHLRQPSGGRCTGLAG